MPRNIKKAISNIEAAQTDDEIMDEDINTVLEEADDVVLEEKVADKLNNIFENPADDVDPTPNDDEEASDEDENKDENKDEDEEAGDEGDLAGETDSTPDDDDDKAKQDEDDEAKDEDVDKGGEKSDEKPPLSDAYYRAAIHRGWKPEEIDEFYKANPRLCVRTFGKIYEAVNRSSKEFAALGRIQQQKQQKQPEQAEKVSVKETGTKGIDIKKLREQYPDDPVVDMIEALHEQNIALKEKIDSIATTGKQEYADPAVQQAREQEARLIEQQIENFFQEEDLNPYSDFYGEVPKGAKDWENLTPGQRANRWTVIQMMDQILTGANVLGQEMDIPEAMRLAHLSVSEPIREKVVRKQIEKSVKKRSKGLSLKPSDVVKPEARIKTEKDLEQATRQRLAKVFGE